MDDLKAPTHDGSKDPHPLLFETLDDLADRMLMDARDHGRGAGIPATGGDREVFDQVVRGAEHTLAKSPPWPLLVAIRKHIEPVVEALKRPEPFVVSLKVGHQMRVLVHSAHEQARQRSHRWVVPKMRHDLLKAIAGVPEATQGQVLFLLWTALEFNLPSGPGRLVDAVRLGRGANDSVSWVFVNEYHSDQSMAAAGEIAEAVLMGRRELPRTMAETADGVAAKLSNQSPSMRPLEWISLREIGKHLRSDEYGVSVSDERLTHALVKLDFPTRPGKRGKVSYVVPESRMRELAEYLQRASRAQSRRSR